MTSLRLGVVVVSLLFGLSEAFGDVVIIVNRSRAEVSFEWEGPGGAQTYRLRPQQVLPIITTSEAGKLNWDKRTFTLESNALYFFRRLDGQKLDFQRLDFGLSKTANSAPRAALDELKKIKVIKVKLLVDDEEPAADAIWTKRLRKRLAAASAILEKHAFVRLEVTETGTWESSDELTDFSATLREFEKRVSLGKADVAIGFTSQYRPDEPGGHLGSARGPLRPHVLVREWSPRLSESGRLEVLLHELGHFLGATHSPEIDSVMRPKLNDQRVNFREFPIQYDALNTMIMCLVVEEWKTRGITSYTQLSPPTRALLTQIYNILGEALPGDPASPRFQYLLNAARRKPIELASRQVLLAIVAAARDNHSRPDAKNAQPGKPVKLTGDSLTEFYIRQATVAARRLPEALQAPALLIGLGIGLDDSDLLTKTAALKKLIDAIEAAPERAERKRILGKPTLRGRRDLAQHYFVSGLLTVIAGAKSAQAAGVVKEALDSIRGSGFSYDDLLADEAGVAFAVALLRKQIAVAELTDFRVDRYMPNPTDLKLDSKTPITDALARIRQLVGQLPVFAPR